MSSQFRGTTICAVRRNGQTAIAGDGQVTMGEHTVFKTTARKVRRLYNGEVVVGFAGSVADAFTLCEKFEEKLQQCGGNLEKAAVALAQNWRGDQMMRQLESMMIAANKDHLLILSGTGEVIDPDEGIAAIGSAKKKSASDKRSPAPAKVKSEARKTARAFAPSPPARAAATSRETAAGSPAVEMR